MVNDGIFQDGIFADGRSAFLFPHMLETVAINLVPESRRVLVLGLGAGIIPGYFAQRGAQVDVVEINAQTLQVTMAYFGYNPGKEKKIYIEDARTFVRRRDSDYDVVLVRTHGCSMAARNLSSREPFRSASVARERLFEDRQVREPVSQIVVSWRKVRVDPDRIRDQSNPSFPSGRNRRCRWVLPSRPLPDFL